jgi:hypothetical protein
VDLHQALETTITQALNNKIFVPSAESWHNAQEKFDQGAILKEDANQ